MSRYSDDKVTVVPRITDDLRSHEWFVVDERAKPREVEVFDDATTAYVFRQGYVAGLKAKR